MIRNKITVLFIIALVFIYGCTNTGILEEESILPKVYAPRSFITPNSYSVGTDPYVSDVCDFQNDNILDIVTANFTDNTVSVLLGNGDGTFQNTATYSTGAGGNSFGIDCSDFNNDGKSDVAVSKWGGTVSILIGAGDGTLNAYSSIPIAAAVYDVYKIIGADVNGDTFIDLIVANCWASTVGVVLGNGDGTFRPYVEYPVGGGAVGMAVGDVNNDLKPDIVVTQIAGSQMVVLTGNGDGTFNAAGAAFAVGTWPETLNLADFNNDNKLDVVATNPFGSLTLTVLLGNGDATFATGVTYTTTGDPKNVVFDDFNGDGKLDMAASITNGDINFFHGKGDGTFETVHSVNYASSFHWMELGDFNGDGKNDLTLTNYDTEKVYVLLAE